LLRRPEILSAWALAGGAAQHAPAAAGGDLSRLLDVDGDRIAARSGFDAAHDASVGAVEPAQPGDAVAAQHVVHGGDVQPQQVGDSGRSPPAGDALMMRRAVRVGVRFGLWCGRDLRSGFPAPASSR